MRVTIKRNLLLNIFDQVKDVGAQLRDIALANGFDLRKPVSSRQPTDEAMLISYSLEEIVYELLKDVDFI